MHPYGAAEEFPLITNITMKTVMRKKIEIHIILAYNPKNIPIYFLMYHTIRFTEYLEVERIQFSELILQHERLGNAVVYYDIHGHMCR